MEVNTYASFLKSLTGLSPKSSTDYLSFGDSINTGVHDELMESILEWYRKDLSDKQRHVEDGHLFNFFDLWSRYSGIGETVHSRLIHFLLYPDSLHGQDRRYLTIFLEMLGISNPLEGIWTITAEKGRVDVRLTRNNPRSVIIIENKSNWAGDQSNQLYRYWYQNIHRCDDDCFSEYYMDKDFRIVYLVPKKEKEISDNSLCKPPKEWFGKINEFDKLPEKVPLAPIVWTFDNEFSQWIDRCIQVTPTGNYPLRSYLSQYMNYCKIL
jgi:hypothetical protein